MSSRFPGHRKLHHYLYISPRRGSKYPATLRLPLPLQSRRTLDRPFEDGDESNAEQPWLVESQQVRPQSSQHKSQDKPRSKKRQPRKRKYTILRIPRDRFHIPVLQESTPAFLSAPLISH